MSQVQHKETASQRYRRKLKENPELLAGHLNRERERDSKRRAEMKKRMETDEDLKLIARIRSKERMQASRRRRRQAQVKQTDVIENNSPRTLGSNAVAKVRVQFLTTIDGNRFHEIVKGITDVQLKDIIAKLEASENKTDGNKMFIEFSASIDVFEKK